MKKDGFIVYAFGVMAAAHCGSRKEPAHPNLDTLVYRKNQFFDFKSIYSILIIFFLKLQSSHRVRRFELADFGPPSTAHKPYRFWTHIPIWVL